MKKSLEKPFRQSIRLMVILATVSLTSGCYIFNFLDGESNSGGSSQGAVFNGAVAGLPLGDKAGDVDEAALAEVYGVVSDHAPAAIRPDPDLFVRRLLRQYRAEGATVARQIGMVEQFRLLLGGATEDFSKPAQNSYDATSLLAVFKVAEDVCRGLVAPHVNDHPGWETILPYGVDEERANIAWLAQRFIGKPSSQIESSIVDELLNIMDVERPYLNPRWTSSQYAKYIPACAALALDAEALYL